MHKMNSYDDVSRFIYAGKAVFTLKSLKTGKHFTYKVNLTRGTKKYWVGVRAGDDYYAIGTLYLSNRMFFNNEGPSVKAFDYFMRWIMFRRELPPLVEFYHEGRCARCGRTLTDPESIERGFGPECNGK